MRVDQPCAKEESDDAYRPSVNNPVAYAGCKRAALYADALRCENALRRATKELRKSIIATSSDATALHARGPTRAELSTISELC